MGHLLKGLSHEECWLEFKVTWVRKISYLLALGLHKSKMGQEYSVGS